MNYSSQTNVWNDFCRFFAPNCLMFPHSVGFGDSTTKRRFPPPLSITIAACYWFDATTTSVYSLTQILFALGWRIRISVTINHPTEIGRIEDTLMSEANLCCQSCLCLATFSILDPAFFQRREGRIRPFKLNKARSPKSLCQSNPKTVAKNRASKVNNFGDILGNQT